MTKLHYIWLAVIVMAIGVATSLWYGMPAAAVGLFPSAVIDTAPPTLYPDNPNGGDEKTRLRVSTGLFSDSDGPVPDISEVPAQGGWINSLPLDFEPLQKQNKVVLVEFWAYTCINCIRADAFTQLLWQRYRDNGLVVIGVHSLEFKFGGKPKNILAAVKRQGLTYPILTDGKMRVWRAFDNRYWPAKYLINPQGKIVYHHFGEGNYEHEEDIIRAQLKKAGYELSADRPLNPDMQLVPTWRKQTPELYAGPAFLRRPYGNDKQPQTGEVTHFKLPDSGLVPDHIYLGGAWLGGRDYVQSKGSGAIALNYQAQAAYVVMGSVGEPRTVAVTLDGEPVPPKFRGKDIQLRDGQTIMIVDEPRLYWPISSHAPYGRHTIRFQVPAGVKLYSFTFGTYQ